MKYLLTFLTLLAAWSPMAAQAHIKMMMPLPRHTGTPPLKEAPCGVTGEGRSKIINAFKPGETITVSWNEFISHPGHFRIAFLQDGDAFNDPKSDTDIETTPAPPILADGLFQHKGGADGKDYSMQITLPNVTCDNCTLQLIQIMTDKAPYTLGGDDVYHECADIVLAGEAASGADGGIDASAPDVMGSNDTASSTGGTGGSGAAGSGGAGGSTGGTGGDSAGAGGSGSGTGGSTGGSGGDNAGASGSGSGTGGSKAGSGGSSGSGGNGGSKASSGGGSSGGCSFGGDLHAAEPAGLALMGLAFVLARRRRRR